MSSSSEPEHHRGAAADSGVVIRADGNAAARAHSVTGSEEEAGQRLRAALGL
jgi:hypothetical protein